MKEYELRSETIVDIIETIPIDRVKVVMAELTNVILQSKISYDVLKALDPTVKAEVTALTWKDDGKGEVGVTHFLSHEGEKVKVMRTMNHVSV